MKASAAVKQLLNRDFMPDHVPKSSLLPKLLIKRNFNSPIFIYRPPINPKRFKIARSKMIANPLKNSLERNSIVQRLDPLGFGCAIQFTLRSFFLPPPSSLDGVLNASSRAPPFCHASSSRCVYLSIQPLSNHRRNIPRIRQRF